MWLYTLITDHGSWLLRSPETPALQFRNWCLFKHLRKENLILCWICFFALSSRKGIRKGMLVEHKVISKEKESYNFCVVLRLGCCLAKCWEFLASPETKLLVSHMSQALTGYCLIFTCVIVTKIKQILMDRVQSMVTWLGEGLLEISNLVWQLQPF